MKKLTKQDMIDRKRKMAMLVNFNYMRLLKEDYPNVPINEYTKVLINKIKKGT
jgi:hypothetical protein